MKSDKRYQKIRGVNLGGWLVLEKWMTPSMFEGLQATDETTLSAELGPLTQERLQEHWQTFITEEDFAWLANVGINAVRIPVGHWLFGSGYPYHPKYGENREPFAVGGVDILDQAFRWAEKHGLLVVVDLHAAPGCQNGFDNGGIHEVCEWHTDQSYVDFSLVVLERLAERYHTSPALIGIQVLNEPRWDIETAFLKQFNIDAYQRIRKYCDPAQVAVMFHDGFRSHVEYLGFFGEPEYRHIMYDIHRYQCFVREDVDADIYEHLRKTVVDWRNEADTLVAELPYGTIVGEWSLGLDLKAVSIWAPGPFNHALEQMDSFQLDAAYRAYAAAQLLVFERYRGWFFWSYKTETAAAWSFRDCVKNHWLPQRFDFDSI
jgi:glucan 1,3-beta-glucosidase